jgi:creatinine amidohydrolase
MFEVRMDKISWVDYQAKLAARPVLFLPCGALEQHGPHLPLGVDAMLATDIACRVAAELGGLVAPPLNYGYKSQARCGGGQTFPGTTSLDGEHLIGVVRDIIREFARHGVERLVLVDGHYENQWFLTEAIETALRELAPCGSPLKVVRTEYWEFCPQGVLDEIFENGFPGFALEHAALIETSMMLALHPELVALDTLPDDGPAEFPVHDCYPQDGRGVPPSGVLASAAGASAAKGDKLVAAICAAMTQALEKEFAI